MPILKTIPGKLYGDMTLEKINQPTKANAIAKNFPQVTQRTIERYIKQLKSEDKIEFQGSPKTGGYVVL